MSETLNAIGLMSGTSMDGIDGAIIETDGVAVVRPGQALTVPFDDTTRSLLWDAVDRAAELGARGTDDEELRKAEDALTRCHAEVVRSLREQAGDAGRRIDVIGFHGQTVLHRPDEGFTVQLGNGALLAELTDCDVVNDFRSADMADGGQGAPFAPAYHMALASRLDSRPVAFLNIGGVGNITYIGDGDPIAFDTGPGNGLIDQWMMNEEGVTMDAGGACAARGTVHEATLARLLDNVFFDAPPPKSLDRFDFSIETAIGLPLEDGAATLTAFTVASIKRALAHLPGVPGQWIICGGGSRNPTLLEMLDVYLPGEIMIADDIGLRADTIEAEAFGYLAVRSMQGLPLSFPTTTGVSHPVVGGQLHQAKG